MRHDVLADVMSIINNAEKEGKESCITPASKLIKSVLDVMKKNGYLGKVVFKDDVKSGKFFIELKGRINCSHVVRPRFSIKSHAFEKWEQRYLPAKNFGILIVSTSEGLMTQKDAMKKNIGGRLLAFVY